jgi:hypothetical protein
MKTYSTHYTKHKYYNTTQIHPLSQTLTAQTLHTNNTHNIPYTLNNINNNKINFNNLYRNINK